MAFIVFEGGDGAGKSTQTRTLYRQLRREGYPVVLTREPGGTPLGNSLRRLVKGREGLVPRSELYLFAAARAQLVEEVIRPALKNGVSVISDRFTASTLAYQGFGRGLDIELIHRLNLDTTGGLSPDLTILLDLHVEVSLARKSDATSDNFDSAPQEFHQRVREGYLSQVNLDPGKWLVLDATLPRQELARKVWAKIQPCLRPRDGY